MLEKNISNIADYVTAGKVNPAEPGKPLLKRLAEADCGTQPGLIVYDFEMNSLFFANKQASEFIGIQPDKLDKYDGEFLENLLHPVSYQLLQFETRLCSKRPGHGFSNVYCIKTEGKRKYSWVYASAWVAGYTKMNVPKLIYICFVEVEKTVQSFLKILNGSVPTEAKVNSGSLIDNLKSRELEILALVAAECTSKEIADKLNITQAAVDAARKRLIQKLGVKSVAGLVKVAMMLGLNGHNVHIPSAKGIPLKNQSKYSSERRIRALY